MAKINLAHLAGLTSTGGFLYASEKDVKKEIADGLIEINTAMVNPANDKEFAIRATSKGMEAVNNTTNNSTAGAPAATTKPTFTIEQVALPSKPKRGGSGRSTVYPFEQLPAPVEGAEPYSFFVPATEKMPDPDKSLSSTVSAANRRYATVAGQKPGKNKNGEDIQRNIYEFERKFEIYPVDGGARIARVK